jgi:hypothetical protein
MTAPTRRLLRHAPAVRRFVVVGAVIGVATALLVIAQAELLATTVARGLLGGAGLAELAAPLVALSVVVPGRRAALSWERRSPPSGRRQQRPCSFAPPCSTTCCDWDRATRTPLPLFMVLIGLHTRSRTGRQWRALAEELSGLPRVSCPRRPSATFVETTPALMLERS